MYGLTYADAPSRLCYRTTLQVEVAEGEVVVVCYHFDCLLSWLLGWFGLGFWLGFWFWHCLHLCVLHVSARVPLLLRGVGELDGRLWGVAWGVAWGVGCSQEGPVLSDGVCGGLNAFGHDVSHEGVQVDFEVTIIGVERLRVGIGRVVGVEVVRRLEGIGHAVLVGIEALFAGC